MPAALIALITASPWQPVRTTSQIPPVVYSVYQSLHPVATTFMEKKKKENTLDFSQRKFTKIEVN